MADRRGIPEWLRRPWARSVKFRQPCKEAKMDGSGEVNAIEQHRDAKSLLFNPHTYDPSHFDDATEACLRRPSTGSSTGARKRFFGTTASVSGTQTSWSSSPRSICSRRWARRRARRTATSTSAGTPAGSRRSVRSWPSTAWTIGTPGRSPSSAWGRSGRATTSRLVGVRPSGSTMVRCSRSGCRSEHTGPTSTPPTWC